MRTLEVTISDELGHRLDVLARATGMPVATCLQTALVEFAETWEQHLIDLHRIDGNDVRAVFKTAVSP
jgi:predicted transcriptional regulator